MTAVRLLGVLLLALVAVLPTGAPPPASADTAAPTPTPATVPARSSKITATYTYRGIPIIMIVNPLHYAYVNGTDCGVAVAAISYAAISDETAWPWHNYRPCNQLGVTTRVCDMPSRCSDEFTYNGQDVRVNVPVGEIPNLTRATAHFVHDSVPQTVAVTRWRFEAGGRVCSSGPGVAVAATVRDLAIPWPVTRCATPGEDVSVVFTTAEAGDLHASFQWNGGDVDYDVDIGAFLQTPTPSPTPTPAPIETPTPASSPRVITPSPGLLPQTGGPPQEEHSPILEIPVGFSAILAGTAAWYLTARRRNR